MEEWIDGSKCQWNSCVEDHFSCFLFDMHYISHRTMSRGYLLHGWPQRECNLQPCRVCHIFSQMISTVKNCFYSTLPPSLCMMLGLIQPFSSSCSASWLLMYVLQEINPWVWKSKSVKQTCQCGWLACGVSARSLRRNWQKKTFGWPNYLSIKSKQREWVESVC